LVRRVLTGAGAVAVVALVIGLNFVQLPVVTLLPGPAEDVLPHIKVTGKTRTYKTDGHLYLTTVGVDDRVNFYEALLDFADRDVEVVRREVIYPEGETEQEVDLENAAEMDDSKLAATVVGLRAAGYKVDTIPDGVRVVGVLGGKPAKGRLKAEDRILAVGGRRVSSSDQARELIGKAKIGGPLQFQVQRDRKTTSVTVVPVASESGPKRAFLGITLANVYEFPVNVTIDTTNIVGPSAGLMFSLSIVERLGPENLTANRQIAGTGTVDLDGNVGGIGGVRQKLIAAKRTGAVAFFVPKDNLGEARKGAPRDLELVPVDKVADAVAWLRKTSTVTAAPSP
jgi:Lon-like protease